MTDREKLVKLLRRWLAHLSLCAADDLIANGVTFATNTNYGGKWISVKERLPKNGEIVLVYAKECGCIVAEWRRKWSEWENWNSQEEHRLQFEEVSHWMPLPEPPKEG